VEKLFDIPKDGDIKVRFLETDMFQTHHYRELVMPEGMSAIPRTSAKDTVLQVQVRTHRKKRINKKWAKRYGFKAGGMKMISMKFWRGKL
jgi:hypothetical protein